MLFILLFGDVEVKGLFFAGTFLALGPSSEEESISEDDDEARCVFFGGGLMTGGALELAEVDEGVLGAGFGAGGLLGASSSSLLLLLESEEETVGFLLCIFTCASGGFLVLLTGSSTLADVCLVDGAGLGGAAGLFSLAFFFVFFFSACFSCDFLLLLSHEACSASCSRLSSLRFFLFFSFRSKLTSVPPGPSSSLGLCLFLHFLLDVSGELLSPFTWGRESTFTLEKKEHSFKRQSKHFPKYLSPFCPEDVSNYVFKLPKISQGTGSLLLITETNVEEECC